MIEVSKRGRAATMVEQTAYLVRATFQDSAADRSSGKRMASVLIGCLVFTRTRRGAERLSHYSQGRDH
jgi:hypothetical protein